MDLKLQADQFNPKKIQLYQGNGGNTNNARLFMIIIRHRQIEKISHDKKTY